jgi:hypothetical protein
MRQWKRKCHCAVSAVSNDVSNEHIKLNWKSSEMHGIAALGSDEHNAWTCQKK